MKRAQQQSTLSNFVKRGKKIDDEIEEIESKEMTSLGQWEQPNEDLIVFVPHDIEDRTKIAAFDMDGTLITTKSGKVFPTDTFDWKFWSDSVVSKLKELHTTQETKLVIFTNQKGIKIKKVDKGAFKQKIETIVKRAGVPIQVYISLGDGRYRKPMTGMWDHFVKCGNGEVAIDMESSVYVGDAAGRTATKSRPKKDHSSADRLYAHNIGLPFQTPEQFFLKKKEEEPWGPLPFCPHEFNKKEKKLLEPEDAPLPASSQEIIVMVGFPGSGKSSFSKKLAADHKYVVVNRDTLGTWQKCVAAARDALRAGKSVVVDNTNPDKESRKRYITLAKEMGDIPVRCFEMTSNMHHSSHNVKFRTLTRGGPDVSSMVLRMHASKLESPSLAEGFSSIVRVNFIPEFDSEDDRKLYFSYLIE